MNSSIQLEGLDCWSCPYDADEDFYESSSSYFLTESMKCLRDIGLASRQSCIRFGVVAAMPSFH